jgi:hypothetical protein
MLFPGTERGISRAASTTFSLEEPPIDASALVLFDRARDSTHAIRSSVYRDWRAMLAKSRRLHVRDICAATDFVPALDLLDSASIRSTGICGSRTIPRIPGRGSSMDTCPPSSACTKYALATRKTRAVAIFDGGVTTVRYQVEQFRVLHGISYYSLRVRAQYRFYHCLHVQELKLLGHMTRNPWFAREARRFTADAPSASSVCLRRPALPLRRAFPRAGARRPIRP